AGEGYADRVPDEDATGLGVDQAHEVLGVAGRVHDLEGAAASQVDPVTLVHGAQPLLGHRRDRSPELRHALLPVDPGGAVPQPLGRTEVSGPFGVDVHRRRREPFGQTTGAPAVVEVDVGDDNVGQVAGIHTFVIESSHDP